MSLVTVLPEGIKPAQSTQAWTVWVVQSQLNQYFTCTLFRLKGPVPVFTTWICGWGLLVVALVTPLNNCTTKFEEVGATVGVEVGGMGVGVRVEVGVLLEVGVEVGGTGV